MKENPLPKTRNILTHKALLDWSFLFFVSFTPPFELHLTPKLQNLVDLISFWLKTMVTPTVIQNRTVSGKSRFWIWSQLLKLFLPCTIIMPWHLNHFKKFVLSGIMKKKKLLIIGLFSTLCLLWPLFMLWWPLPTGFSKYHINYILTDLVPQKLKRF